MSSWYLAGEVSGSRDDKPMLLKNKQGSFCHEKDIKSPRPLAIALEKFFVKP